MFGAWRPRHVDSPFIPGRKRVVNSLAICINVFLPSFVFTSVFFLMIISFRHREPDTAFALIGVFGGLPLCSVGFLAYYNSKSFDPSWFKFSFLLIFLAVAGGLIGGQYVYMYELKPYYDLAKLQTYPQLDVSKTSGRHVQDAGRVYFAAGTKLDLTHAWHFQSGSIYCVAPIMGDGQDPSAPVDFWAIGKDCCDTSSSDFRCGDYNKPVTRSGLRFLESDAWFPERHLYRLAVEGAEAMYGITAPDPLFFTWVQDPLYILQAYKDKGWGHFMLGMQAFFTLNVVMVFLATWRFAYLGRGEAKPLLDDD